MTVNNGQQIIRTVQDFEPTVIPKTINLVDDGTNAPHAEPITVSKDVFDKVILDAEIHGPRTVNPNDPSAPGDTSDKGTIPANSDAPYILTAEPEAKSTAIGDYLASLDEKPILHGADEISYRPHGMKIWENDHEADGTTPKGQPAKEQTWGEWWDSLFDWAGDNSEGSSYVNSEEMTGNGPSLPDIDGMLTKKSTIPSGLGLDLGLINSLTGGKLTFGESGLGKLDLGGKSSDIGSMSGLDALMQKFGMDGFSAHLKDGSFDLDNFSAGAPSAKGPILDLDGNGQQDMIEWALSQIISDQVPVEIVEEFHNNPAWAEFHQSMMDKYADMHIA